MGNESVGFAWVISHEYVSDEWKSCRKFPDLHAPLFWTFLCLNLGALCWKVRRIFSGPVAHAQTVFGWDLRPQLRIAFENRGTNKEEESFFEDAWKQFQKIAF